MIFVCFFVTHKANVITPPKKRGRPKLNKTTPKSANHTIVSGALQETCYREPSSDSSNPPSDMEWNDGSSSVVVPAKRTARSKSLNGIVIFIANHFFFQVPIGLF